MSISNCLSCFLSLSYMYLESYCFSAEKQYDSRYDKLRKQYEYNWIGKHKHIQNYLSFCKIDHPKFMCLENKILSLSWCISDSFYRIWVPLETYQNIERKFQKSTIWCQNDDIIKTMVKFGHLSNLANYASMKRSRWVLSKTVIFIEIGQLKSRAMAI